MKPDPNGLDKGRRRCVKHLGRAVLHVPFGMIICLLLGSISNHFYGLEYASVALLGTALLVSPLFVLMSPGLRNLSWGMGCGTIIYAFLLLGNAAKIAYLQTPLSISDIQALPVLLNTLSRSQFGLAAGGTLAIAGVALASIKWRLTSLLPFAAAVGYLAILPWITTLVDRQQEDQSDLEPLVMPNGELTVANDLFTKIAYLQTAGPLPYLRRDWFELNADSGQVPTLVEVSKLGIPDTQVTPPNGRRNIHMVLLESIWDLDLLEGHRVEGNAFDPRFLAAWEKSGRRYALSPAMGGSTANAEFEALCAFHAPQNSVAFVNLLRQPSPCLPAILAQAGYRTIASHAHEAANWNRVRAYNYAGFESYYPVDAFEMDDMDGPHLADSSFFRQNLDYLKTFPSDRPTFNYLVSLSSHWSYPLNRERRPDVTTISPNDAPLLHKYANTAFYTTHAFMDWAQSILQQDPDAIIIALGDHAPVLDENPDPYEGVNTSDPAAFDSPQTRKLVGLAKTPLLVIDGERGPFPLDQDIPMYELPRLLGELMHAPVLLPQLNQPRPLLLRPMFGTLLLHTSEGWRTCAASGATDICADAVKQFEAMRTLRQDVVHGKAYYLAGSRHPKQRNPLRDTMTVSERLDTCDFEVESLGPLTGEVGRGFNTQNDGASALWITMKHYRGMPAIRIDGSLGASTYHPRTITSAFSEPTLFATPRNLEVTVQCKGQPPVSAGHIAIQPIPQPASETSETSVVSQCSFDVDFWGPAQGVVGEGFNRQLNGKSAMWIKFKQIQGTPRVYFGDETGVDTHDGDVITSAIEASQLPTFPGKLPIYLQCLDADKVLVGEMEMVAP